MQIRRSVCIEVVDSWLTYSKELIRANGDFVVALLGKRQKWNFERTDTKKFWHSWLFVIFKLILRSILIFLLKSNIFISWLLTTSFLPTYGESQTTYFISSGIKISNMTRIYKRKTMGSRHGSMTWSFISFSVSWHLLFYPL